MTRKAPGLGHRLTGLSALGLPQVCLMFGARPGRSSSPVSSQCSLIHGCDSFHLKQARPRLVCPSHHDPEWFLEEPAYLITSVPKLLVISRPPETRYKRLPDCHPSTCWTLATWTRRCLAQRWRMWLAFLRVKPCSRCRWASLRHEHVRQCAWPLCICEPSQTWLPCI